MKEKSLTEAETLIKDQIEVAHSDYPSASDQTVHKIAVLRWFCDEMKLDDAQRLALGAAWQKTPSGFGANDSQLRQKLGMRIKTEAASTGPWK